MTKRPSFICSWNGYAGMVALALGACSGTEESLTGPTSNPSELQQGEEAERTQSPEWLFDDPRLELIEGDVIFEGDIIVGPVEDVMAHDEARQVKAAIGGNSLNGAGLFDLSRKLYVDSDHFPSGTSWPNHTINWRFDDDFDFGTLRDETFREAIEHYKAHTSLKFVEKSASFGGDVINVRSDRDLCNSYLGRRIGPQDLNIGGSLCFYGGMLHELGHAIGLMHEHQRPDRDLYVDVLSTGNQVDKESSNSVLLFGDYDVGSIMHYGHQEANIHNLDGTEFSANRDELSDHDIRSIQVMYGAQFQSTLSAVSWGSNRMDIFVRGTDKAIHHRAYEGSGWITNWGFLGGSTLGAPEAIARASNKLDLFVRGADRRMYHKYWSGGPTWVPSNTGWNSLGGSSILTSDPVAVSPHSNRIDVFARHSNGVVRQITWQSGSGWSDWVDRGVAPSLGSVEAVSWGSNRIDLFTVGPNRDLLHKWWNGTSWLPTDTGWESLGGYVVGKPSIVARTSDRLEIVIKDLDDAIQRKFWNGSTWWPSKTTFEDIGGVATGHPVLESWGPNRMDMFWTDRSTLTLKHRWWTGSWSSTEDLGGGLYGAPEVISWGSDRLDIFVRGADNAVHRRIWNGTTWGPTSTGFEYVGGGMSW